jgi:hypothetical protein
MKIISCLLVSSLFLASAAMASNSLMIHHKVTDYTSWRKAFDGHKSKQMEAGLTNPRVFQTDGNPNDVTILFDASDVAKAKAFTESKDLKMTMQKAGVQGQPEMHVLVTE